MTEFGIDITLKFEDYANAYYPIYITESGIIIDLIVDFN